MPPANLRDLRLISSQMKKSIAVLAGESIRLHRVLTDGGIRIWVVISDIYHGKSRKAMIKALVTGGAPAQPLLRYADPRLKASQGNLLDALAGDLSAERRLVDKRLLNRIAYAEGEIEELRQALRAGRPPSGASCRRCMDQPGAPMLLVEIGDDRQAFAYFGRLSLH